MGGNTRMAVAIHIMTALACSKESMTSTQLAGSIGTNPVVVRRLLILLGRAGLIRCTSGKTGGSTLARDMRKISLADIYDAVAEQESLFPIPEKNPNRGCRVSCRMQGLLKTVFGQAESALQSQLKTVMLSDFAKEIS
jgi:Rrf2 family protein